VGIRSATRNATDCVTITVMPAKKKKPSPVPALRTQGRAGGVATFTAVETARILTRRYKVMTMRKDGVPLYAIALTLGIGADTVREDIREVLGSTATALNETAEEARNLELVRFDALLSTYQPLAEAGNLNAAALVLSISDRKRKMLAIDVPEPKEQQETGMRIYVGIDIDGV
jgi:hypothetical protein